VPNLCILTDSTAQFPTRSFRGQDRVNVIPISVSLPDRPELSPEQIKTAHLPASLGTGSRPLITFPSTERFVKAFDYLASKYDQIMVVLSSGHLSPLVKHARAAAEAVRGKIEIEVIDSHSASVGLGLLVQTATAAAEDGLDLREAKRVVLGTAPHIYSVFCVRGLSYLESQGFLDHAQAWAGEQQGVFPFYVLEKGRLIPALKIRNARHMVDCLHEFVTEFSDLHHIALLQGIPAFEQESRGFRERVREDFGDTPISEHTIEPGLAAILGPKTLGMFVWEDPEE
jgi:DegV family protein with EDD domain